MPTYKYAGYPSAKIYDSDGNQIKHLLWGDWVEVTGGEDDGKFPVRSRGADGFMYSHDLQEERLLEFVFVDVGQGDGCLMVTPDDKKYIIDAGVGDNMYRYLKWRFNFRGGIRSFDGAVLTHPDQDHYYGFLPIFKSGRATFKRIFHNGIMERKDRGMVPFGRKISDIGKKWVVDLIKDKDDLVDFLSVESRYGTKRYANTLKAGLECLTASGDVRMVHASDDPEEPTFLEGFGPNKEVSIQILGPVLERDDNGRDRLRWFAKKPSSNSTDPGKTKNGHSVVLILRYGNVKVLFGGDLNSSAEAFLISHYTGMDWPPQDPDQETQMREAARERFGADISKCCHHGSADFLDTFLGAVNAAGTVVSSGDEESHAHPRSDTLGAIGRNGRGRRPLIFSTELTRSTRENEGNLPFEIGRLRGLIEEETDPERVRELTDEREKLIDELKKRNVTSYGAINFRTDGERAVVAYMLEKPRSGHSGGRKLVTRWDIYKLEKNDEGTLAFVEDD